jgi:hypothetical protein
MERIQCVRTLARAQEGGEGGQEEFINDKEVQGGGSGRDAHDIAGCTQLPGYTGLRLSSALGALVGVGVQGVNLQASLLDSSYVIWSWHQLVLYARTPAYLGAQRHM